MVQDASKSFGLEETLKAVKAGNADAKYSDLWGANNPVQHGRGGDPKHIAKYIEACFSGNTLYGPLARRKSSMATLLTLYTSRTSAWTGVSPRLARAA